MEHPYKLGQKYLVRTVTMYHVGRLEEVYQQELVFTDCSWVADTGRFNKALTDGVLEEVEPIPGSVIVGRGSIVDVEEWNHPLPEKVK